MLYLEMNIIIISVILLIYVKVVKNIDHQTKNLVFSRLLLLILFISVVETLQVVLNGKVFAGSEIIFRTIVSIKYALTALISCYWCHYLMCESVLMHKTLFKRPMHMILVIPCALLIVMSIVSAWTGWIFDVDANGCFMYGKYHLVQTIITYSYFTVASVSVLISIFKPENVNHLFTQLMLIVLPFVLGMIHLLEPRLITVWPGLTVILLVKFVDFQEEQIFVDSLTGINNRRSFDKYLSRITKDHNLFSKDFFLYMIDVDHFKHINDTYGHIEGDSALVRTAEILKGVCNGKNAFLSRYGGDEFAVIYVASSKEMAHEFFDEIKTQFAAYNLLAEAGKTYSLNVSVGYAAVPKHCGLSVPEIINNADFALYREKNGEDVIVKQPAVNASSVAAVV